MFDFEWFKKKTEPVEPIEGSLAGIISRIISENEVEKKGLRD